MTLFLHKQDGSCNLSVQLGRLVNTETFSLHIVLLLYVFLVPVQVGCCVIVWVISMLGNKAKSSVHSHCILHKQCYNAMIRMSTAVLNSTYK